MSSFKVLDCTFRDGGYYNKWDFGPSCTKAYLEALNKSGVEIVEIGYRSLAENEFYGLYKYCPENQLQFLKNYENLSFAFMLDVKEFLDANHTLILSKLQEVVSLNAKESVFSWCRLASTYELVKPTMEIASFLHKKGYKTTVNLMASSLLSDEQKIDYLTQCNKTPIDIFYFADSFGNFTPEEVKKSVKFYQTHYKGELGFHPHNNQELAYANTLAAIDAGINWVDGTILGMGRGAGNLKTESILLGSYFKYNKKDFDGFNLLDVINTHFMPLKQKYGWGSDFAYMLSGIENIHPTYGQQLKSSHQYTLREVAEILHKIPNKKRHKFDKKALQSTIETILNQSKETDTFFPIYKPSQADNILIVARGASVTEHNAALKTFIEQHDPLVIECNDTGVLDDIKRTVVVLNSVRLKEQIEKKNASNITAIISGQPSTAIKPNTPITHFPYRLESETFSISSDSITLPTYLAGAYALGIALLHKPKHIFLAGFDGFSNQPKSENEMDFFWEIAQKSLPKDIELKSVLPTQYNLPITSIFRYLT